MLFGFKGRVPAGRHAHPTLPGTLETPHSSNRLVDESGGVRLTRFPDVTVQLTHDQVIVLGF
jgi:hypothetical protein